MSDGTKIEWTDASWNPIRATLPMHPDNSGGETVGWHCERVSPGCQNCYAETINQNRFGTGLPYTRPSRDEVDIYLDEKTLLAPLRWRKPRRVFVCSMTDLFGEWVTEEMLDRVFAVMALTPHITYQVLTKRPERMRDYLSNADVRERVSESIFWDMEGAERDRQMMVGVVAWPLPNVWLGTSVEDQQRADERVPVLLETPAAVRFLSCEPLLGPVNCNLHMGPKDVWLDVLKGEWYGEDVLGWRTNPTLHEASIDWVIVGGESGPGARPCNVEWIRRIVQQCQSASVPVFVKQLGSRPFHLPGYPDFKVSPIRDRKGGDPDEWPEDLRRREFPEGAV